MVDDDLKEPNAELPVSAGKEQGLSVPSPASFGGKKASEEPSALSHRRVSASARGDVEDDPKGEEEDAEDDELQTPPPSKAAVRNRMGQPAKVSSASSQSARTRGSSPKGKAVAVRGGTARTTTKRSTARRQRNFPASHYLPHAVLGMALIGLHVWFDWPYAPIAVLGIAVCVYAYMQMGSANEIAPPM